MKRVTVDRMGIDYSDMDDRFAEGFRLARQESGLSQEEVAERVKALGIDLNQPVIGKIERRQRRVTIGEARALSAAIGVDLGVLLKGPDHLRFERARDGYRRLRREFKEAANNLRRAQLVFAAEMDALDAKGELRAIDRELWGKSVVEPFEAVLEELRRDNLAESEGRALRDRMDEAAEEPHSPREFGAPGSFTRAWSEAFASDGTILATDFANVYSKMIQDPTDG